MPLKASRRVKQLTLGVRLSRNLWQRSSSLSLSLTLVISLALIEWRSSLSLPPENHLATEAQRLCDGSAGVLFSFSSFFTSFALSLSLSPSSRVCRLALHSSSISAWERSGLVRALHAELFLSPAGGSREERSCCSSPRDRHYTREARQKNALLLQRGLLADIRARREEVEERARAWVRDRWR